MSGGYIGETPRRIKRAWINIPKLRPDSTNLGDDLVEYLETEDTSFQVYPFKEYYELVDEEYVKTTDFYIEDDTQTPPLYHTTMDPLKTYYEKHPIAVCRPAKVRRAWVGDENGIPRVALDARPYLTFENTDNTVPSYSRYASLATFNNQLHLIDGVKHFVWDWTSQGWIRISTLPLDLKYGRAIEFNNKLHILGCYDPDPDYPTVVERLNNKYTRHFAWDGTSWTEEVKVPFNFQEGAVVVINNALHVIGSSADNTDSNYSTISNLKKHYSYNGYGWSSVSTLPFDFSDNEECCAFVNGSYIQIIGSPTWNSSTSKYVYKYYYWTGSKWTAISAAPSVSLNDSGAGDRFSAVVKNNIVYWINGHYIYTRNGSGSWYQSGGLPGNAQTYSVTEMVLYDDNIHLISSYRHVVLPFVEPVAAYSNYGSLWMDSLYTPFPGSYNSFIYDGKYTCLLKDGLIFSLNSETGVWEKLTEAPYNHEEGYVIVYNNEIHILGGANAYNGRPDYRRYHYSWNGTTWTNHGNLPFYCVSYMSAVVYNDKLYVMGVNTSASSYNNNEVYSWNGTTWTKETNGLFALNESNSVVYKGKIHVFGGPSGSYMSYYHYSFDGTSWVREEDLPYTFTRYGCAIVYEGEVHLFGGDVYTWPAYMHREWDTEQNKRHYSWDGTTWTKEADLPIPGTSSWFLRNNCVIHDREVSLAGGKITTNRYHDVF